MTVTAAPTFSRKDLRLFALSAVFTVASGVLHSVSAGRVVPFVVSGLALAVLASLVGRAVEALGDRLGAGATGVLQSALGNLPELFVCGFALSAGLLDVVRATLVGSILANVLLVLGGAFVVGGLKHGTQRFDVRRARTIGLLLVLSVSILAVPALTSALHTPARSHERPLSTIVSVVMIALFALSLPAAVRKDDTDAQTADHDADTAVQEASGHGEWPVAVALGVLAVAGVGAALVSDWFVAALTPAMDALHVSDAFAGLVIVAIAGNAVENVVGLQLMRRNQADYALSVILQSPIQIALIVAPVLVLVAPLLGASAFTLVLSPLLLATLLLSAVVTYVVTSDGESTWYEGCALIGLYVVIASAFWWG